jgi:phosphoribosylglycinamide formyltransferase 1
MTRSPRLAVLISGGGTTLQNFIDQMAANTFSAHIALVVSSNPTAFGLERAKAAGIPSIVVSGPPKATFSERVFHAIRPAQIDLVILAGWLKLLSIPEGFRGRVLNIHPSLLPKFGGHGMYGHHVHEAVLRSGETHSGCTVHYVDDSYDTGPIVLQRDVEITDCKTPSEIAAKVFEVEKLAYPAAIRKVWELKEQESLRR